MTNAELNKKILELEARLTELGDISAYVRDVAKHSKELEDALKVASRQISVLSAECAQQKNRNKDLSALNVKTREAIDRANKMSDNVSKKVDQIEKRVDNLKRGLSNVEKKDAVKEHLETERLINLDLLKNTDYRAFKEFVAGRAAFVFFDEPNNSMETKMISFLREIENWAMNAHEQDNADYYVGPVNDYLDIFTRHPSVYHDREPFAVWLDPKYKFIFEEGTYVNWGTLQSDWREHGTVGGITRIDWA